MLPSPVCVAKAITGLYVMEDWHNFGADYDKTLMHGTSALRKAMRKALSSAASAYAACTGTIF